MDPRLIETLSNDGVLVRRELGPLVPAVDWAVHCGELKAVLPGVYVARATPPDWRLLALAACRYADDVVITGAAAAALTFRPRMVVSAVEVVRRRGTPRSASQAGIVWRRGTIPTQHIVERHDLRFTTPAWTAVDMCGSGDASWLDEALRYQIPLAALWQAYSDMPARVANPVRKKLLIDSRDLPWSPAERLAHRLLRQAGITGWQTNVLVLGYALDVAWLSRKVCLEIDGFEYHGTRASFESDRLRDQRLVAEGWVVIRVTWQQLIDEPSSLLTRLRRVLRRRSSAAA